MNHPLGLISMALLIAGSAGAWAQTSAATSPASAPATRAEVKQEADAAKRAGAIPQGEAGVTKSRPQGAAQKGRKNGGETSRADVKADSQGGPRGQAGITAERPQGGPKKASGEKSRDEVKAEAARAKSAGEIPQGEASTRPKAP